MSLISVPSPFSQKFKIGFPWRDRAGRFSPFKLCIFLLVWTPAAWFVFEWKTGVLGPRPLVEIVDESGLWAIRFLFLSLTVTPLRQMLEIPKLIQIRRMVGLAAFFYGLLHLSFYMADLQWDWLKIGSEIILRLYLTIGALALLGLLLLGITSTDGALRKLGKAWQKLHYLAYGIGFLALLHFFMQSKLDLYEPAWMMGSFVWLMMYRWARKQHIPFSSLTLFSLAILAASFTMLFEASWYQWGTHVAGEKVLAANFKFRGMVRPGWWVLWGGLVLPFAAGWKARSKKAIPLA